MSENKRIQVKYSKNWKHNSFEEYKKAVTYITELQDLSKVENISKHNTNWHLDHIISIRTGFDSKIPAQLIADVSNLRIIHRSLNHSKRAYVPDGMVDMLNEMKSANVKYAYLFGNKPKKKYCGLAISQEVYELFKTYCDENNMFISKVAERLILKEINRK